MSSNHKESLQALIDELSHGDKYASAHKADLVKMFLRLGVQVDAVSFERYSSRSNRDATPSSRPATSNADGQRSDHHRHSEPGALVDMVHPPPHSASSSTDTAPSHSSVLPNTTRPQMYHNGSNCSANMRESLTSSSSPVRPHRYHPSLQEHYQRRAEKQRPNPFAEQNIFAPTKFIVRDGFNSVETRTTRRYLIPNQPSFNRTVVPDPPLTAIGSPREPSHRQIIHSRNSPNNRPGALDDEGRLYRLPVCPRALKNTVAGRPFELMHPAPPPPPNAAASPDSAKKATIPSNAASSQPPPLPRLQVRFERTFDMLAQIPKSPRRSSPPH